MKWAGKNRIVRLELTVECINTGAKYLYEKNGFTVSSSINLRRTLVNNLEKNIVIKEKTNRKY